MITKNKKTSTAGMASSFLGHMVGHAAATAILEITDRFINRSHRHSASNVPATTVHPANAYAMKRMVEGQLSGVVTASIQQGITLGISQAMQAMDDQRLARLSTKIPDDFDIAIQNFVTQMLAFDCDTEAALVAKTLRIFIDFLKNNKNGPTKRMMAMYGKYYSLLDNFYQNHTQSDYRRYSTSERKGNLIPIASLNAIHAYAKQIAADIGMELSL